jgi:hypothetical protein
MNIFLDETGYTGEDLVNPAQPVFVLASHNFTEEESQELKSQFFGRVHADELKHTSLARRPAQQEMVVSFLRHLSVKQDRIKAFVAYKPFVLVAKMVDSIVEPVFYEEGLNLYHQGANLALTNLLFYCIPAFSSEAFFHELLLRFQGLYRYKTPEAYDHFFEFVFVDYDSKELNDLLGWFRLGHTRLGYRELMGSIPKNYLDIAFTMSLNLMSNWRLGTNEPIHLKYDSSSNMTERKEIWDALVDPALDPITLGYDRRTLIMPIAVKETIFESSHNWAGLQLADVLAGATARFVRWYSIDARNPADEYASQLSFMIDWPMSGSIFPEEKFTPEDLGTVGETFADPIAYFGKLASKDAKRASTRVSKDK